jgi:small subunit ribosomal protein S20
MQQADLYPGRVIVRLTGLIGPIGPAARTDPERGFRVANIKSQIKRNQQNEKARLRNKAVKSSLKTSIRKFREAAESGDMEETGAALRAACRQLDKAASKGVIHKSQAANRKSAIAKAYAALDRS